MKRTKINPDGFVIRVELRGMPLNSSIFVPCLNTDAARRQLRKSARLERIKLKQYVVVEQGISGVRAWRIA
jgi:hypothetical protein